MGLTFGEKGTERCGGGGGVQRRGEQMCLHSGGEWLYVTAAEKQAITGFSD